MLSEEHKAVLLAVIGYRGVSESTVGEIVVLEASSILDDFLSQGVDLLRPARELNFWRLTPSALLALGLRSHTDISALKELEEWFDSQIEMRAISEALLMTEPTAILVKRSQMGSFKM